MQRRLQKFTSFDEQVATIGANKTLQALRNGLFPINHKRFVVWLNPKPPATKRLPWDGLCIDPQEIWRKPPTSVTCRFASFVAKPPARTFHRWWLFAVPDDAGTHFKLKVYYNCSDSSLEHGSLALPLIGDLAARLGNLRSNLPCPVFESEELLRTVNREIIETMLNRE
ncbi:hypothetical protein LOC68_09365 [Blastopirellula sp. JC732]|uniref:Uncharacterized protein n=1 Tax=Blastopirellula sediminis TaxID=2894196 RepID=A0A9X1MLU4_9BACT|nr:hypothetical protein [Blastopirellula sediminis]MCC9608618.1 hypothetical protein [Blastopirellula sediminis]MCC9628605.1 hypothetical protein [Blastopirellula sediminis]